MVRTLPSLLLVVACSACNPRVTTVYLVRHAEKAHVQGDDPNLSAAGRERAQALAAALDGVAIDAVYATQYRRTLQTIAPLADARDLEARIVSAHDTGGITSRVAGEHRGQRVLIAGHSNTVPDLVRALGVRDPVVIAATDYGDLFVVTIAVDGSATLERRRFGP